MNLGLYGILILFGLFVLLLIINPSLSCFGRTIRSPFYPFFRKKKQRRIKTQDYGFRLVDKPDTSASKQKRKHRAESKPSRAEDYGFNLVENKEETPSEGQEK